MTSFRRLPAGGIACYPTETCWGLGGRYDDRAAYKALLELKRCSERPFLVLVGDVKDLEGIALSPADSVRKAMDAFWPGPLTLLFDPARNCPDYLVGESGKVAVRMSPHDGAKRLISLAGPLVSTSANLSGQSVVNGIEEARRLFGESVSLYWDDGEPPIPPQSSTLAVWEEKWRILREGPVSLEELQRLDR